MTKQYENAYVLHYKRLLNRLWILRLESALSDCRTLKEMGFQRACEICKWRPDDEYWLAHFDVAVDFVNRHEERIARRW